MLSPNERDISFGHRSAARRIRGTSLAFLTILFIGLFAMAARNSTDPDLWWHLATGRYIVQHQAIPRSDPFSYTRAGSPWIAHEWLTDFLLYELHGDAGWAGLIVVFAAIITAALFLLYLRCGPNVYVAGVATLCAALATRPVWGIRPQGLSFFLTSLWLLLLERSDRNPGVLWWTIPLTVLWINLHAGFALGLIVYALFLVGDWIENQWVRRKRPPSCEQSSSRFSSRTAWLILVLDLLVVPLNPNGLKLFWYPIQTLRSSAMQTYIAEWASPNFHRPEYWPFLVILLTLFAVLSRQHMSIRFRDLLLLIVSLFAALRSIRLIPFFVLIAIPLIAEQVAKWLGARPVTEEPRRDLPALRRHILNTSFIIGMALFAAFHAAQITRQQPLIEARTFPAAAAAFLQTNPPALPLFNSYDWGGYLIWKLYPSIRVFIDGRADIYGDQFMRSFADTYGFRDDWQQTFDRWHIQTVLVPADSTLAMGLQHAPGWTVAFEDRQTVIFTRCPSPGATSSPVLRNPERRQ